MAHSLHGLSGAEKTPMNINVTERMTLTVEKCVKFRATSPTGGVHGNFVAMRGLQLVRLGLLLLLLLIIVGCGGGGKSSSSSSSGPIVSNFPVVNVDWPARVKNVTAPSAASTVTITIEKAGSNGSDATVVGSRNRDDAYTQGFTLPLIQSGEHTMVVRFYPSTDVASSAVVASATLVVRVNTDGTIERTNGNPLGTVTTSTALTSVGVQTDQVVPILQDKQLYAYGMKGDSLVALPSGSVTWTLVPTTGNARMTLTSGGVARGARLGWAEVKASVDGVTSATTLVRVGWQSYSIVNERTDVFAACAGAGNRLWAVATDGYLYALSRSDLSKGSALVSVGSASTMAASADEAYVYVPTVTKVNRYNTSTGTIDQTFAIDAKDLTEDPYAIAVDPTNAKRVAVAFKNPDSQYIVAVFENGVRLQNAYISKDQPIKGLTFNETGRILLAYSADAKVTSLSVGTLGLTIAAQVSSSGFRTAAPYLQTLNGVVYTHNLQAYSTSDLSTKTAPEQLGVGYGLLVESGITPRLYSAQVENGGRASGIVVYQDNGSGFTPITGLDIPTDRFVANLIAADANGFVYITSGATLIRVNVKAN